MTPPVCTGVFSLYCVVCVGAFLFCLGEDSGFLFSGYSTSLPDLDSQALPDLSSGTSLPSFSVLGPIFMVP